MCASAISVTCYSSLLHGCLICQTKLMKQARGPPGGLRGKRLALQLQSDTLVLIATSWHCTRAKKMMT